MLAPANAATSDKRTPTRCGLPSIHKACEDVRAKFMQTFESGTRVVRVYERNAAVDSKTKLDADFLKAIHARHKILQHGMRIKELLEQKQGLLEQKKLRTKEVADKAACAHGVIPPVITATAIRQTDCMRRQAELDVERAMAKIQAIPTEQGVVLITQEVVRYFTKSVCGLPTFFSTLILGRLPVQQDLNGAQFVTARALAQFFRSSIAGLGISNRVIRIFGALGLSVTAAPRPITAADVAKKEGGQQALFELLLGLAPTKLNCNYLQ
eukprot:g594.t1